MGLSLLNPFAIALFAVGGIAVLAHLARQTPQERQAYGAMLLLRRVVKRLRRRRRIKDPWLLLLRLLAVLLVVLAATGPRWSWTGGVPEFGGTGRVVLVIDQSLSMSLEDAGATLLTRARADALQTLRELPEGTEVGLVVYGEGARRLTGELSLDHERVAAWIEDIGPTYGRSNLSAALLEARTLLGGVPGEVLVFSDEAGPRMVREAQTELARLIDQGSAVIPRTHAGDPARNVAVTSVEYGDGIEGGRVTMRVTNFGSEPIEVGCEVELPDGQVIPVFVDLPPEGQAEERITVPPEAAAGVGRAHCEDPDLPSDDSRYFHLPRVGASRVLVVDGDPGDTPTESEVYYLERALAPWGGTRSGVTPELVTPAGLGELDPEHHRVVFLANVSDPRPIGPMLTSFVQRGGNLVLTMGDQVTPERYNAALGSVLPAPMRRIRVVSGDGEDGVRLSLPDTQHTLFEPFARTGRPLFADVRTFRLMTMETFTPSDEVEVLLQYDNGLPALVSRTIGKGRVLVWTSTIDWPQRVRAWSNLPLQSIFMPLVQRMVTWMGGESGGGGARFDGIVGEPVVLPLPDLTWEPEVLGPSGNPVKSRLEGSSVVFTPERPGGYALALPGSPPLAWVAVNTAPEESDVRAVDSLAAAEAELSPELFMRHVDLDRPLLAAALVVLLLASLVALRREQESAATRAAQASQEAA